MDNYTFPLVANLMVPYSGAKDAYITYPKEYFALCYEATHRAKLRQIEVSIFVSPLAEPLQQTPLKSFLITEEGFETSVVSNSKEVKEWEDAKEFCAEEDARLRDEIVTLYEAQRELSQDSEEWRELSGQIALLEPQLNENQRKFQELLGNPVLRQYIRVNRYDDVASYFVEGELTPEGIEWAKTIPFGFGESTIGDYI